MANRLLRGSLHGVLVNRLGVSLVEVRPSRNQPEFGRLAVLRTGTYFDAARVNLLFRFATGQVFLRVHRALSGVLVGVLLIGSRIAVSNNDQLGVGVTLQAQSDFVEDGLAGIVDAPRTFLVLVEGAGTDIAGL